MEDPRLNPGDPGYWEWRGRTGMRGKAKAFKNPQHLWRLACEYFERVDNNPFLKQEQRKGLIKIDKDAIIDSETLSEIKNPVVELKNIRPYTWMGFTDYLFEKGYISTMQDYKSNREGKYDDYVEVIRVIDDIMYSRKFEGAAVGAFNASIIARDLGLVDKVQNQVTMEQPLFADDEQND